ncbi:hypothetical protein [Pueribacillus sp. YX66]|uniref:hypothetical protein n=1 Tax=Pueribacillus sp. YX66 TaxID=3229242 RepID=UPI0036D36D92
MALSIISAIASTDKIILGFMVATGSLSMWISNTATAMMMVPIRLIKLAMRWKTKESHLVKRIFLLVNHFAKNHLRYFCQWS